MKRLRSTQTSPNRRTAALVEDGCFRGRGALLFGSGFLFGRSKYIVNTSKIRLPPKICSKKTTPEWHPETISVQLSFRSADFMSVNVLLRSKIQILLFEILTKSFA